MPGFQNRVVGHSLDGQNWTLLEPLVYECANRDMVRAAVGTTTDGPSIPPDALSVIRPWGLHYLPAVLHDAAYRDTLEGYDRETGDWKPCHMSKAEADNLFREAMIAQGCTLTDVELLYNAVHYFGQSAFDADRKKP